MSPIRVLLIEDDTIVSEIIPEILTESASTDFLVTATPTLKDGIAHLKANDVDVILLDLGLPDSDGLGTLTRVNSATPDTPIVIMTGLNDESLAISAMRQGAEDYLLKTEAMSEPALSKSLLYAIERKRSALTIRRREGILQAMRYATEEFLTTTTWDVRIRILLERLGTITGVTRIQISKNNLNADNLLETTIIHEWLAPDCPFPLKNSPSQTLCFEDEKLERWQDLLEHNKAVYASYDSLSDYERPVFDKWQTKSILILPIFVDNSWWGCLRFDHCSTDPQWTRAEIDMLKSAANTLSLGIRQHPTETALQAAHAKLVNAREEERRHLARELHDSIAQKMLSMQFKLKQSKNLLAASHSPELNKYLTELYDQNKEIIADLRHICHGLYPPALEHFGLCFALTQLAEHCQNSGISAKTRWTPETETIRFRRDIEISLFRIAQAAVSNAMRHAKPNAITVELEYKDNTCTLSIIDDGSGFDPAEVAGNGLGLGSMQEHASALSGILKITSQRGQTRVTAKVPAIPTER